MKINFKRNKKQEDNSVGGKKSKKRKYKLAKRNKIIIGICGFLLVIFICVLIVYLKLNGMINLIKHESDSESYAINYDVTIDPDDIVEEDNIDEAALSLINADAEDFYNSGEIAYASYVKNILLIGTDVRVSDSWNGNSDSMILISINTQTKKIYMTSFMRDMYVYVPYADVFSKLNYAHAYGGSQLLCETISGNFKIQIDDYFRVDFYGLMDIIDAAGGVPMEISQEEITVANKYILEMSKYEGGYNPDDYYLSTAGTVNLNGAQAVAYARIRYVGNSDYERTNRQRKILSALFEKAQSLNVAEINSFVEQALPNLVSNMENDEIWDLIGNALVYLDYEIVSQRVPFDDTSTSQVVNLNGANQSVLVPDYKTNAQMLIDTIYATK